jgi:hypothetical protein
MYFYCVVYVFLCCTMYCLCVTVYCHRVTTQLQLIRIIIHVVYCLYCFLLRSFRTSKFRISWLACLSSKQILWLSELRSHRPLSNCSVITFHCSPYSSNVTFILLLIEWTPFCVELSLPMAAQSPSGRDMNEHLETCNECWQRKGPILYLFTTNGARTAPEENQSQPSAT